MGRDRAHGEEEVIAMGRHGGAPTPRAAIPGRGVSTTSAGVLVALTGGVVAVLTVLGVTLMGVPLLPRPSAAAAAPTPTPTPSTDQVALAASPAQGAIAAVLGTAVATGWTPSGALAWSGGTPFDAACGRPVSDAALSGSRVYDLGGSQVVLTVSAYPAGAGAVAMRDWAARLAVCSSAPVTVAAVAAPSPDAFVATLAPAPGRPGAAALFWRHGDVVAIVAVPSPDPRGLPALAAQADPRLVAALAGVCANLASTVADGARSPWLSRDQFTGLASPIAVTTSPVPTPAPPPGVTPVPATWSPAPLPSVSIPVRPADPVWPADLPPAVPSPSPPSPLAPAPLVSVVPSRLDDPVGPGCGWAFTGQVAPPFDAGTEAVLAQTRVTQAQQDLAAAQQDWQVAVLDYWQSVADYQASASAYSAYVASVGQVAQAWDRITTQRQDYANAVAAYNLAIDARSQFLLDQAAAQTAYDAAVVACQPPPTSPPATDTATATPVSTPTSTPTDTPTPAGCPPPIPDILTQVPPTVPPVPTPPPDPRPTG